MKKLLVLSATCLFALPIGAVHAADFRVGAAKVDITPDYPVRLAGYGSRKEESQGVAQKIWARAVAIDDQMQTGTALLINVESCGVPDEVVDRVCQKIEQQLKVPRQRIVICSTHTHSAPWLIGYAPFLSGTPLPEAHVATRKRYTTELEGKLLDVAGKAIASMRDANLYRGTGTVGFAANRRVLRDGTWTGFGVQADGPTDHRLPILHAKGTDGKTVAIIANYACHCTTLGGNFMQISGDWSGFAQDYLEQDHPGAVALSIIGCGADMNPEPRGSFDQCKQHGRALADAVNQVLKKKLEGIEGPLECRLRTIPLPLAKLPTTAEWEQKQKQGGSVGQHATHFLDVLKTGKKVPSTVDYPVATWTFSDDLACVFLGGEVVVDYAIRLHREFAASRLWITAYANDVPCYIPSRRILAEGGYEADYSMVYYGVPTRFDEAVEDLVVDTVQKLLPPRFYGKQKGREVPPPVAPETAEATFQTSDEMVVQLVASEPLIVDPVAFDWDLQGGLWVVEMRDYPTGMDEQGRPGGRVKRLVDEDGDGVYDKATVFVDNLPYPTGVKVWADGVLITAAPHIIFAKDTTGDGVADQQQVLYEGFGEGNQQHRVNGLRWGLDNWLYLGNGDSGGRITSKLTGKSTEIRGRDLRIRPGDGQMQAVAGQTQYGRCRDDWGNWFGGNNSQPLWHYVLDDGYLRRNAKLRVGALKHIVLDPPGAAPVYPTSTTLARFNDFDKANRFTSACSPIIYRDRRLGEAYVGNMFVCEPVHNLVHRSAIEPQGFTFRGYRVASERSQEFLSSTDNWFRPAMVRTGPDGAVWVADMYRLVIEHPKWIPQAWQQKLDLRAGKNRGRIYRVYHRQRPPRAVAFAKSHSPEALATLLESPNGWLRDMGQEQIVAQQLTDLASTLRQLLKNHEQPHTRLQALCTLDGLGQLQQPELLAAVGDPDPGVRRHAIRLAEPWLDQSARLLEAVCSCADDRDPQVRLQLAYSLGESTHADAAAVLAQLIDNHRDNRWFVTAALSSIHDDNLLQAIDYVGSRPQPSQSLLTSLLQFTRGENRDKAAATVFRALVRDKKSPDVFLATEAFLDALNVEPQTAARLAGSQQLDEIRSAAAEIFFDTAAPMNHRLAALRLLGRDQEFLADRAEQLGKLLSPQQPIELQRAVVTQLGRSKHEATATQLLDGWAGHSPSLRDHIMGVILQRKPWTAELLARISQGDIAAADLAAARQSELRRYSDSAIQRQAQKLLADLSSSNRQAIVDQWKQSVPTAGDLVRGKEVYQKRCANCHQTDQEGRRVGPDLAALTDRSRHALLVAVLDPNRAVEDRYQNYLAVTEDGRQVSGVLANEASNSITLIDQEAKRHVLLRSELYELKNSRKSLMPEGLENELKPADMADVIVYVQSIGLSPKTFDGNQPQLAPVRDDGSIRLLAIHAKIYGPTLIFEPEYRNLGYWQSEQDHASWELEVPRAGKYRVTLDYACHRNSAGNRLLLSLAGQTLHSDVESSGEWNQYRSQTIGTVELPKGRVQAVMRSDGPIRGALIDLRGIRLQPR